MSEEPKGSAPDTAPGRCMDCCYFHHGDAAPSERLLAPCLHSQLIVYQLTVWGGGSCHKFKARP